MRRKHLRRDDIPIDPGSYWRDCLPEDYIALLGELSTRALLPYFVSSVAFRASRN
jgi:hypothetical protein